VEASLGRLVRFWSDPNLVAHAAARTEKPQGRVYLRPDCVDDLSVIAEEVMHLHRMAEAYPVIKPLQRAANDGYADVLNGLSGFFDEHAFFPFLEELGLDPRKAVGQTIGDSLRKLPEALPRIRGWQEPMRSVKLSALFVQTNLMAPNSEARTELLRAFQKPPLDAYRELGEFLCDEIGGAREEPPPKVEARMRRCVDRLGLPSDAAVVAFEPFRADMNAV
jgi:hypothetical protein